MVRFTENSDFLKVYFDTEFTGLHNGAQLISIGMVSDYDPLGVCYLENLDINLDSLDPWIKENVIPNLTFLGHNPNLDYILKNSGFSGLKTLTQISDSVESYLLLGLAKTGKSKVQLYSDVCYYDWVVFCDLWESALNLPDYISPFCIDLVDRFDLSGLDPFNTSRDDFADIFPNKVIKHNALYDALVIKKCFERLRNYE